MADMDGGLTPGYAERATSVQQNSNLFWMVLFEYNGSESFVSSIMVYSKSESMGFNIFFPLVRETDLGTINFNEKDYKFVKGTTYGEFFLSKQHDYDGIYISADNHIYTGANLIKRTTGNIYRDTVINEGDVLYTVAP